MAHPHLTLPLYFPTPYPSLYSLSILLSTVPLYNPFLQLVVPLGTRQPLHMNKCHLMLHLHSPSYSSPFYIPFSTSPFYTPSISSSLQSASTPFSTISTAQSPLGSPLVTRQPPLYDLPPLQLPFYSSYLPALRIPFLHTFSTPLLYPISTPYLPTIWLNPL